jgi:hypothetical protein
MLGITHALAQTEVEVPQVSAPSEEGRKLVELVSQMRRLYLDLAGLLGTFEDLTGAAGWERAHDDTCLASMSAAQARPDRWSPREVFRFVKHDRRPGILGVACVLLENRGEKEQRAFDEPLVATSWLDFAGERLGPPGKGKLWDWWYARWHTYLDSYEYSSWVRRPVESFPESERVEEGYRFRSLSSRVVPLSSVVDSQTLQALVVQPFLEDTEIAKPDR